MRLFLISLIVISSLITGCSTTATTQSEFDSVWTATEEALNRRGLVVKPSRLHDDTLVAISRVNGDYLTKSRMKVVARVLENEDGYYEPSFRVIMQVDNAELSAYKHANTQQNHRWINVSTNDSMEAELYNEVMAIVNGRENGYSGRGARSASVKGSTKYATKSGDTQTIEFTPETW